MWRGSKAGLKPDWNRHAKAAPFRRNDQLLSVMPYGLIVFPGSGITENLADVSTRIVRSPQTVEIEVARPNEAERLAFLQAMRPAEWFASRSDLSPERLAQLMSGLTRIQLRQILSSVDERGTRLDAKVLREQKKAVIEAECYGLLEYVESPFGLDMVAGHDGVKTRLRRAAQATLFGRSANATR